MRARISIATHVLLQLRTELINSANCYIDNGWPGWTKIVFLDMQVIDNVLYIFHI